MASSLALALPLAAAVLAHAILAMLAVQAATQLPPARLMGSTPLTQLAS
jgi:hypothetical protein